MNHDPSPHCQAYKIDYTKDTPTAETYPAAHQAGPAPHGAGLTKEAGITCRKSRPSALAASALVVVMVSCSFFVCPNVLRRIFIERCFARRRAEVVRSSLVVALLRCFVFINLHSANRIVCHLYHLKRFLCKSIIILIQSFRIRSYTSAETEFVDCPEKYQRMNPQSPRGDQFQPTISRHQ